MPAAPRPVASRARGALLGHAIGDALGLGAEFMSAEQVGRLYPQGLRAYEDIVRGAHQRKWEPGEATDDTGQMLALARVLVDRQEPPEPWPEFERVLAGGLADWMERDPRGIGRLTMQVLCHRRFREDPTGVAEEIWIQGKRRKASNGSLMRLTPVGVAGWQDPSLAARLGARSSAVTHADPRCIDACRVAAWLVAHLVADPTDPGGLVAEAARVAGLDETRAVLERACAHPPGALRLDEGLRPGEKQRIGYVYTTLAAGVSALVHAGSLEEGLLAVIHAGGDADTNGAVAGGLLGARFGEAALPERWLVPLRDAAACRELAVRLVQSSAEGGDD